MEKLFIKRSLYYRKRLNMCANSAVRITVSWLSILLIVLILVLIACVICHLGDGVSLRDVCGFGQENYRYHKAILALLTLLVANVQISRYLTQYTLDSILGLRDKFDKDHFKEIQQSLIEGDGSMFNKEEIESLNFLGYVEIGSIMLQKGLVTKEQFFDQFGYILELLCDRSEFVEHVNKDKDYYNDLLFAICVIYPDRCEFDR